MPHRRSTNYRPASRPPWQNYALPSGDEAHSALMAEIHLLHMDMDQAFSTIEDLTTDVEDVKKLKRYLTEGGKLLWACLLFGLAFAGKLDWSVVTGAVLGTH